MDVAAVVAACTASLAAIMSLVNVVVTAHLERQRKLRQWRREEVTPVVMRVLDLSREAIDTWNKRAILRFNLLHVDADPDRHTETLKLQNEDFGIWQQGDATVGRLRYEVAQLDLIAPQPVRDAAEGLRSRHEGFARETLHIPEQSRPVDALNAVLKFAQAVKQLENDLIEQARTALGTVLLAGRAGGPALSPAWLLARR